MTFPETFINRFLENGCLEYEEVSLADSANIFGPIEKGEMCITVAAVAVYCVALAQEFVGDPHVWQPETETCFAVLSETTNLSN